MSSASKLRFEKLVEKTFPLNLPVSKLQYLSSITSGSSFKESLKCLSAESVASLSLHLQAFCFSIEKLGCTTTMDLPTYSSMSCICCWMEFVINVLWFKRLAYLARISSIAGNLGTLWLCWLVPSAIEHVLKVSSYLVMPCVL